MPAPLLDALSAWMYLTGTLQFEPKNIILSGSSAGGNLSVLLSRYLAFLSLPQPGVIALSSPWLNMAAEMFPSATRNASVDYLSISILEPIKKTILRHYTPQAASSPWFSPALVEPKGWTYLKVAGTKVYIMRGTKELLADEIAAFAKTLQEAGVDAFCRDVSAFNQDQGG